MKYSIFESTIVTNALGSCIGMAVYDPKLKAGALLHFMLPDSNIDRKGAKSNPYMFADTGFYYTMSCLEKLGCKKNRLIIKSNAYFLSNI